jgi:hypothetical protein
LDISESRTTAQSKHENGTLFHQEFQKDAIKDLLCFVAD